MTKGPYPRLSEKDADAYNSINRTVDKFIQDTLDEEWDSYASNYYRKEADSMVESALRRIGDIKYDSLFDVSDVSVNDEFLTPNAREYIKNIGRRWV